MLMYRSMTRHVVAATTPAQLSIRQRGMYENTTVEQAHKVQSVIGGSSEGFSLSDSWLKHIACSILHGSLHACIECCSMWVHTYCIA